MVYVMTDLPSFCSLDHSGSYIHVTFFSLCAHVTTIGLSLHQHHPGSTLSKDQEHQGTAATTNVMILA
jgi:hypothetical protein